MTQTRQDVENRLAELSEAISRRVSALEGDVRIPGLRLLPGTDGSRVSGRTLVRAVAAVAGGLIAWRLVRRMLQQRNRHAGMRDWAADVADDAHRFVEQGIPMREAVDRAARLNAAGLPAPSARSGGGVWTSLIGSALETGIAAAVHAAVRSFAKRSGAG